MSRNDNIILYNYNYTVNKNELFEGEIIYDYIIDVNDPPISTLIKGDCVELKVSQQNDRISRQTEEYFPTPHSKIKTCSLQCNLNTLEDSTGYISRIGVFDDHNDKTANHDYGGKGYFFALIDNVLNIGVRNGTIDNGIDILIPQTEFNNNQLIDISWSNTYIYNIEFAYKGDVHFYVNTGSGLILVHYFNYIENQEYIIPSGNLPIRYEIIKTGTQENIGIMKHQSSQVYISNKFYSNDTNFSSLNLISQSRGKFYSLNKLISRGYIQIRTHTHEGGSKHKSKNNGNHKGKKHSSHHKNNHITPTGYHTPHTRPIHIHGNCDHPLSNRCRHPSHTGYVDSISVIFDSSNCTKAGCDYHHHKQMYAKTREYFPLFSIRLVAYNNRTFLKQFSIISNTKSNESGYVLSIIKNPIFLGINSNHWHVVSDSSIEYSIDSEHICQTKIDIVYQKWIGSGGLFNKITFDKLAQKLEDFVSFDSNIAGEPNIYTFAAQRINTDNPNILLSMEWLE